MANNLDTGVSDLKEENDVERLKTFLQAPENEGICIAYIKNGRVSYLAKIGDKFIHVDGHGRSAANDLKELLNMVDPKAKLIDLTGWERLKHLNFDLSGPPDNPKGLIEKTVWQLKTGTYTPESVALRKLSVLANKPEEPSMNPPTSGNFPKR